MKVAVVGSRSITDKYKVYKCLDIVNTNEEISEIISGGAKGVDSIAKLYAFENKIYYKEFLPDWNKYGKSAGYKRNKLMIEDADFVVIIWDGKSKGTKLSLDLAKELKKDYALFKENNNDYVVVELMEDFVQRLPKK